MIGVLGLGASRAARRARGTRQDFRPVFTLAHDPVPYWLVGEPVVDANSSILAYQVIVRDVNFRELRNVFIPSALDGLHVGYLYGNAWVEAADGKWWFLLKAGGFAPNPPNAQYYLRRLHYDGTLEASFLMVDATNLTDGLLIGGYAGGGNTFFALDEQSRPWVPTHAGLRRLDPDTGEVMQTVAWPIPLRGQFNLEDDVDQFVALSGGKNGILLHTTRRGASLSRVSDTWYYATWEEMEWVPVRTVLIGEVATDEYLYGCDPLLQDGQDRFINVSWHHHITPPQQFSFISADGTYFRHQSPVRNYAIGAQMGDVTWVQARLTGGGLRPTGWSRYRKTRDTFDRDRQFVQNMPVPMSPWRKPPWKPPGS